LARVIFDARVITPRMHGIARYAYQLLHELLKRSLGFELVALCRDRWLMEHVPGLKTVTCELEPYRWRELIELPRRLARLHADLYYTPSFNALPLVGPPQMMTVHDLTHLWPPLRSARHLAYYEVVVGPAARRSRRVITETRFVARQLLLRLRVRRTKLRVIPSGAGLGSVAPTVSHRRREVLCIVNDKPHKNAQGALAVAQRLARARKPARLVLIGGLPDHLALRAAQQNHVEWLPYVEEHELLERLANAGAFLFPSFSEGFGYPPLEAMSVGTPVVASSASCIPEVLGTAACYADPYDPDEMARQLLRLLDDPQHAAELSERGRMQVARYRWDAMALALHAELDAVLAEIGAS
jgi:glycosyltransferase involved in cell wall biosynthesis